MKVTINVLASDFENNRHMNITRDLTGCPVIRALIRAGLNIDKAYDYAEVRKADYRVCGMFMKREPIQDFSFEIQLN